MPRIASVYQLKPEKMPFDFTEVVAAFAPRAFLASAPVHDDNFEVSGVKDCLAAARVSSTVELGCLPENPANPRLLRPVPESCRQV
jgi:hypothetical protein